MAVHGVDFYNGQGDVDFSALKAAGVEFVILKCGYGSNYVSQDDARFRTNVRKAKAAGMPYGVYLYSYALRESQAESEAQHALRLLQETGIPLYGVWYDMEDADGYKAKNGMPSNSQLVRFCEIFCDAMEAAGYYAGIYASKSWLDTKLNSSRLDKYDKWVAQWNSECTYSKPYGIWQYTDRWVIGGVAFDGDWAYKDYPSIVRSMHGEKPAEEDKEEMAYTYENWKAHEAQHEAEVGKQAASDGWGESAMEWAKENGIMSGDPDGSLRPHSDITREEEAQTLKNLLESEAFAAKVREILQG